jgi:hypothetical protein
MLKVGAGHVAIRALPIELPADRRPVALVTLKNRALSPVAQLSLNTHACRQDDGQRLIAVRC